MAKKNLTPKIEETNIGGEPPKRYGSVVFTERTKRRLVEHTQRMFDAWGIDTWIIYTGDDRSPKSKRKSKHGERQCLNEHAKPK